MKNIVAILMFVIISSSIAFGQTIKGMTESGEIIILNTNNRTWFFEDTSSNTQVEQNDCSKLFETKEDKVTGTSTTTMKELLVVSKENQKQSIAVSFTKTEKNIALSFFLFDDVSCFNKGAIINVLFTDGTRVELASNHSFNCEGISSVFFGGAFRSLKELEVFRTKKIEIVRVRSTKRSYDGVFSNRDAEQFINALNCLTQ